MGERSPINDTDARGTFIGMRMDTKREDMLLAVLEKRAGYFFAGNDVYVNVVGGLKLDEPALDLTIVMALVSSLKDYTLRDDVLAFGEIGLAGEIRGVSFAEKRISEAFKTGFRRLIIPRDNLDAAKEYEDDMEICAARNIREAAEWIIDRAKSNRGDLK